MIARKEKGDGKRGRGEKGTGEKKGTGVISLEITPVPFFPFPLGLVLACVIARDVLFTRTSGGIHHMPQERVRDVLRRAKVFHDHVGRAYTLGVEHTVDERVRLLLGYLRGHARALSRVLVVFEKDTRSSILDTWIAYPPDKYKWMAAETMVVLPDASIDDVIEKALAVDQNLMDVYGQMREEAASQEVRDVFDALTRNIRQERCRYVQSSGALQQM